MPEYYEDIPLLSDIAIANVFGTGNVAWLTQIRGLLKRQCQLVIDSGWVKAFPRPDSELISRERAESATGTCWCNNVPFTEAEKEDITRYIIQGAEIQRDHMVMQGWRKVLSVEQLIALIRNTPRYKWEYEEDYAQRLSLALQEAILKEDSRR